MMSSEEPSGHRRIVVPIGDKTDPNMLTELAGLLVDPRQGAVRFVHVTTDRSFVASQENWRTGSERVASSQHTLRRHGIESTGSIRTASSPARGILDEAEEYDADAILLGWTDKDSVSRLIDTLLRTATCDVLVFKAETDPGDTNSILVPIVAPPHEQRLRLAAVFSQRADAAVTFVHIVDGDGSRADGEKILRQAIERIETFGVTADTILTESNNPIDELGSLSADYDVMIIGTSRGWWLRQTLFGRKTDTIAVVAECSLLMHKWQSTMPPGTSGTDDAPT